MIALVLPLTASTVMPLDFEALSQRASSVIGGRITNIESEKDASTGYIYSTITVAVTQAVPAELAGREYTFRMLGGEVGGDNLQISDFPRLAVDQSVVLFLQGETASVFGPTVGLWQGVFFVESDIAAGRETVTDHLRRPVLGVRDRELVRGFNRARSGPGRSLSAGDAPEGLGMSEFFEQIRQHRGAGR